jgi:hypothetical protein
MKSVVQESDWVDVTVGAEKEPRLDIRLIRVSIIINKSNNVM